MIKFTSKMVRDYILGNDIDEYSSDELENDPDFMIAVINRCNDEKMIDYCSREVKHNYEFVKFVVCKFRDNIDLITKIADDYLAKSDDEFSNTELVIMMCDLTEKDKEIRDKYLILRESAYMLMRVQIEMAKAKENDEKLSNVVGMGFWLMFDAYHGSEIILDYYAERTIDAIFDENEINLEDMLHKSFKNSEDIDMSTINNYILAFVGSYDQTLESYLSVHVKCMDKLKGKIESAKTNWDRYNDLKERTLIEEALEEVHDYMHDKEYVCPLSEEDLLDLASRELGIRDKIYICDTIYNEDYGEIDVSLDEEYVQEVFKTCPEVKFHYNAVLNIMKNILHPKKDDDEPNGKIMKLKKDSKDKR